MRPKNSVRRIAHIIIFLLVLAGCSDPHSGSLMDVNIVSPEEGNLFLKGEAVSLSITVNAAAGYQGLEVYLNGDKIGETESITFDTLLSDFPGDSETHRVVARAINDKGHVVERIRSCAVVDVQGRSASEVDFTDGSPSAWFLSGWTPLESGGFDNSAAIESSEEFSLAITRKDFAKPGHIRFYVGGGEGNLKFYVDGKLKSKWFGKEGPGSYAYSTEPGDHIYKWIASGEGVILDEVIFVPGIVKHTRGEYYEGGIIYHLDSSGIHGLIAAREDGKYDGQREIPWGCRDLKITFGNRAESNSDGLNNTLAIVNSCAWDKTAARYCYDLLVYEEGRTWEDWYLPAIDELDLLHTSRAVVGNLFGEYYWSSTSNSTNSAGVINFFDGSHHGANRNIPLVSGPVSVGIFVRPIRAF